MSRYLRKMRRRFWTFRSHVPGTRPWQVYRKTDAWIDEAEKALRASVPDAPDFPDFPRPLPRNPAVLHYAIETMMGLLREVNALERLERAGANGGLA